MGAERGRGKRDQEGRRRGRQKHSCAGRSKAEAPFELPVTASVSERAQAKVPVKPGDWKYSIAALYICCVICAKRQLCRPLSRSSDFHFRVELLAMGSASE